MFSVCLHLKGGGGYPYPIMLCNITQNAMGQQGGYPGRAGVPWRGGTLPGGYPSWGVPWWGVPCRGGTLAGWYPARGGWYLVRVPPRPGQDGGGTQLGQHREYLLHGGRYASCVHAGGLSCQLC